MKATEAQVEEWKKKYHSPIFEYTALEDGKEPEDAKRAYFRAMTPQILDVYQNMAQKSRLDADQMLIDNLMLAGDDEFKNNDAYILGLREWLGVLLIKVSGVMSEL